MNKSLCAFAIADEVLVPEASWIAMESFGVQANAGEIQALVSRGISG